MSSKKNIIYGLTDPRTGGVRYIGRSSSGLNRPRQHKREILGCGGGYKGAWIRKLNRLGLSYGIVVLEECENENDLDCAECRWISKARSEGWNITNYSDGGDRGLAGKKRSPETKARISASIRRPEVLEKIATNGRRKKSEEHRRRIGMANKGRIHSPETRSLISQEMVKSYARRRAATDGTSSF